MDFSNWTRADFIAFDEAKAKAFQPTQEEIDKSIAERKAYEDGKLAYVLSMFGLSMPEKVDMAFLLDFASRMDLKQYVGENWRRWIENQVSEVGDCEKTLRYFVVRYL
jgi:hypothetical protein